MLISMYTLLIFCLSFVGLLQHRLKEKFATPLEIRKAKITPPVSILVPAHNEEKSIAASIKSLLNLEYGEFEVVVINDGSKDKTLDVMKEEFQLREIRQDSNHQIPTQKVNAVYRSRTCKNLIVIDKQNGGKADSLNTGINICSYPLFCCIDADSILEKHSLLRIAYPYMEAYSTVVATGGLVRALNGCTVKDGQVQTVKLSKKLIVNFQVLEYFRSFLSGRMGFSALNCLLIISGAFGLFKKQVVIEAGGYRHDTVGEDMELVVRLHHMLRKQKKNYSIQFIPDPVCWTEAPEDIGTLGRQRNRWQRGLGDSLLFHIEMLGNPRYGTVGMVSMPYFFFIEFISPIVEYVGYAFFILGIAFGTVDVRAGLLFFFLTVILGVLMSLISLLMEEITFDRYNRIRDLLRLIAAAVIENFGYRQYITFVRTKGLYDYIRGNKSWGVMKRAGIS